MAEFWVPVAAMQEVWQALGGDPAGFTAWMHDDPRRTPADAWAQLLAAIQGDLMAGDTNPPPGALVELVEARWFGMRAGGDEEKATREADRHV